MKTFTSKRRFGSRAGSSMVEFALGSGVLVAAFTFTFQYGFIFYQYNALFNAVNNLGLGSVCITTPRSLRPRFQYSNS